MRHLAARRWSCGLQLGGSPSGPPPRPAASQSAPAVGRWPADSGAVVCGAPRLAYEFRPLRSASGLLPGWGGAAAYRRPGGHSSPRCWSGCATPPFCHFNFDLFRIFAWLFPFWLLSTLTFCHLTFIIFDFLHLTFCLLTLCHFDFLHFWLFAFDFLQFWLLAVLTFCDLTSCLLTFSLFDFFPFDFYPFWLFAFDFLSFDFLSFDFL